MRKAFILMLVTITLLSTTTLAQTRRRTPPRRRAPVARPVVKPSPEIQLGRERIAMQIKTLSQFLYLYGGIAKGIESAEQAARSGGASSAAVEQNERIKARVKDSIKNLREGLDKLEIDFSSNSALRVYYATIAGVARAAETAESQVAANRYDEAGRTLLKAVNQLADALSVMR